MTVASPTNGEIRQARAFLQGHGVSSGDISPRRFASAAKELGKGYAATLKHLVLLLSGGQGNGPSQIATADYDRTDPTIAIGKPGPAEKMRYDNVAAG